MGPTKVVHRQLWSGQREKSSDAISPDVRSPDAKKLYCRKDLLTLDLSKPNLTFAAPCSGLNWKCKNFPIYPDIVVHLSLKTSYNLMVSSILMQELF